MKTLHLEEIIKQEAEQAITTATENGGVRFTNLALEKVLTDAVSQYTGENYLYIEITENNPYHLIEGKVKFTPCWRESEEKRFINFLKVIASEYRDGLPAKDLKHIACIALQFYAYKMKFCPIEYPISYYNGYVGYANEQKILEENFSCQDLNGIKHYVPRDFAYGMDDSFDLYNQMYQDYMSHKDKEAYQKEMLWDENTPEGEHWFNCFGFFFEEVKFSVCFCPEKENDDFVDYVKILASQQKGHTDLIYKQMGVPKEHRSENGLLIREGKLFYDSKPINKSNKGKKAIVLYDNDMGFDSFLYETLAEKNGVVILNMWHEGHDRHTGFDYLFLASNRRREAR
jgi:hypothetical protein